MIHPFKLALLLLVALAGYSSPATATGVTPAGSVPANLSLAGEETLAVDATRYTIQNLDWTDTGRRRSVPARLYLPTAPHAPGGLPLVVFSHGIGGSSDGYSYSHFAHHGHC